MTERQDPEFDHEIDTRAVVRVGIQLIVVTVVSAALMWPLLKGLGKLDARSDTPPVALQAERDALARQGPAGTILQASPQGDLQAMRAAEKTVLEGYGWVDDGHTVARVPISRAIELLAVPAAAAVTPAPRAESAEPSEPGASTEPATTAPTPGTSGH